MGNRAVLTFGQQHNSPSIYLHWNGGRASVEAFLQAARELGLRHCETNGSSLAGLHAEALVMDDLAGMLARHYFDCDVGFTIYRQPYGAADKKNGNHGVYLLNRDLTIGGRLFAQYGEEVNAAKTAEIVAHIVAHIVARAPAFTD